MDTIYLNLDEKVEVIGENNIKIGQIGNIYPCNDETKSLLEIVIAEIPSDEDENHFAISAFDVIKAIDHNRYHVINVGEAYSIVKYCKEEQKENNVLTFMKVAFICATLFCGGAIAIMTFQTDAALPDVFKQLYFMLLGDDELYPYIIEVPYSIGVFVGITVFFNHVFAYKITKDPTPVEVEMRTYEMDVHQCIIKHSNNNGSE